jgi:hypothetical protein
VLNASAVASPLKNFLGQHTKGVKLATCDAFQLDTFESPADTWTSGEGSFAPPVQDCTTSYTGNCSLKVTASEGVAYSVDGVQETRLFQQALLAKGGYSLDTFPVMCYAYRVPSGHFATVNFTLSSLESGSFTKKFRMFLPKDDYLWHYQCDNIKTSLGGASQMSVLNLGLHNSSAGEKDVIWLDDFSICGPGRGNLLEVQIDPASAVTGLSSGGAAIVGFVSGGNVSHCVLIFVDDWEFQVSLPSTFVPQSYSSSSVGQESHGFRCTTPPLDKAGVVEVGVRVEGFPNVVRSQPRTYLTIFEVSCASDNGFTGYPVGCNKSMLGNGFCDSACNTVGCLFDGRDCPLPVIYIAPSPRGNDTLPGKRGSIAAPFASLNMAFHVACRSFYNCIPIHILGGTFNFSVPVLLQNKNISLTAARDSYVDWNAAEALLTLDNVHGVVSGLRLTHYHAYYNGVINIMGGSDVLLKNCIISHLTHCPIGFLWDEGLPSLMGEGECTDVDECLDGTHRCDPRTNCTNTAGSYSCSACPHGTIRDGVTACVNITSLSYATHASPQYTTVSVSCPINISGHLFDLLPSNLVCSFDRTHGATGALLTSPGLEHGYVKPSSSYRITQAVPAYVRTPNLITCTAPGTLPAGIYKISIRRDGSPSVLVLGKTLDFLSKLNFSVFPSPTNPLLPADVPVKQFLHLGTTLDVIYSSPTRLDNFLDVGVVPVINASGNTTFSNQPNSMRWTPLRSVDGTWQVRGDRVGWHWVSYFSLNVRSGLARTQSAVIWVRASRMVANTTVTLYLRGQVPPPFFRINSMLVSIYFVRFLFCSSLATVPDSDILFPYFAFGINLASISYAVGQR